MNRTAMVTVVLVAGLITSAGSAAPLSRMRHPQTGQATTNQATATQAAPFLGDWVLALQGDRGAATFNLSIKVEKEKIVCQIVGEQTPAQAIADITLVEKSLTLRYAFDYQGNPVDVVISLTPAAEGKTSAQMAFAGGAYVISGTATKKEK